MRDSRKENNRLQMQQNRKQAKYAFWYQKKTDTETPDEMICRVISNTASQQRSREQNKNNKRKQPSQQKKTVTNQQSTCNVRG